MADEEQLIKEFEDDVRYLAKIVPPDDIYCFAQQALNGGVYFLKILSEYVDIKELMEEDELFYLWVKNIGGIRVLKNQNFNGILKTGFDDYEDNY